MQLAKIFRSLILAVLLLFTVFCGTACAAVPVPFAWDYTSPMPSGFELRIAATAGGPAVITFDCGAAVELKCTVPNVPNGNWFAVALAYEVDSLGKQYSDASNEVQFTLKGKPAKPVNLRFQ